MVRDLEATIFGPVSMLNFPQDGFDVGLIRYNSPKKKGAVLFGICFNYKFDEESGLVISEEPSIYESEKVLLKAHDLDFLSKSSSHRLSPVTQTGYNYLPSGSFQIKSHNQKKMLLDLSSSVQGHFEILKSMLVDGDYSSSNHWNQFCKAPVFSLNEIYGVDIQYSQNSPFSVINFSGPDFKRILKKNQ